MMRLILSFFVALIVGSHSAAGTVFALLVCNTDDEKISQSVNIDKDNVKNYLKKVLGAKVDVTVLTGAEATGKNIVAYYDELKERVRKDDTLFFYYSGHGGISETGYQRFALAGEATWMAYNIQGHMNNLRARLNVFIYDCCSNKAQPRIRVQPEIAQVMQRGERPDPKKDLAKVLFMESKGWVVIASSQEGKPSFCHPDVGGIFTYSLIDVLCQKPGAPIAHYTADDAWSKVFHAASKLTQQRKESQAPLALYLNEQMRYDSYVRVINNTRERITLKYRIVSHNEGDLKEQEWTTCEILPGKSRFLGQNGKVQSPVFFFEYEATGQNSMRVWEQGRTAIKDKTTGYGGVGYNAGRAGKLRTHVIEIDQEQDH